MKLNTCVNGKYKSQNRYETYINSNRESTANILNFPKEVTCWVLIKIILIRLIEDRYNYSLLIRINI